MSYEIWLRGGRLHSGANLLAPVDINTLILRAPSAANVRRQQAAEACFPPPLAALRATPASAMDH